MVLQSSIPFRSCILRTKRVWSITEYSKKKNKRVLMGLP
nr:MAG TPA: hypothetical protein [Caudoviricetes sp.]